MVSITRPILGIALSAYLSSGCTQKSAGLSNSAPMETQSINFAKLKPGMNFITFTSFTDGKIRFVDGCFRLLKNQTTLAIIWPETMIMVRKGNHLLLKDVATQWSGKIGDRVRLGGKTLDDISAVELDNRAVMGCAGPYFVASNIIRR
jgi:hypothetical protein